MATAKLKSGEVALAPLTCLQVAEFLDDQQKENGNTQTAIVTRSLRTVAHSLANAGHPLGATIDEAITILDSGIEFPDLNDAFIRVLDISRLRKATEGEAPAAESTSSESTAAS